ncbi:MAG: HigA family addiction module antidote protein [Bacteroidales bacterium]|jgi:HTH-type transcriptional regulator/antitoxin HigA|nr:HigA family addiction module antidote protein [Bacteroidales bacterium]
MKEIVCGRNIHPGEVMREEIKYIKLSRKELSKKMSIPYIVLNDILKEKSTLTIEIATKFEEVVGFPAKTLMRFQYNYDIRVREEKEKTHEKSILKLRKSVMNYEL